ANERSEHTPPRPRPAPPSTTQKTQGLSPPRSAPPPAPRPPLARRAAPGGRGQGAGADQQGRRPPRPNHLPELLPPVQEAVGHDRHRRPELDRAAARLQAVGHPGADQPPVHPPRLVRPRL